MVESVCHYGCFVSRSVSFCITSCLFVVILYIFVNVLSIVLIDFCIFVIVMRVCDSCVSL